MKQKNDEAINQKIIAKLYLLFTFFKPIFPVRAIFMIYFYSFQQPFNVVRLFINYVISCKYFSSCIN